MAKRQTTVAALLGVIIILTLADIAAGTLSIIPVIGTFFNALSESILEVLSFLAALTLGVMAAQE